MRLLSNQHTLMPQPNAAQPCDSQNTTKTHQHTQIPITSQTYNLRVVAKSTHIADKPYQESPHQQKPATMSHTQHNSINITPPPVIICVLYQTNTHSCHNQMLPNPVTHKTTPKPTHTHKSQSLPRLTNCVSSPSQHTSPINRTKSHRTSRSQPP